MDPVTVSITIARPREQVFEYLADIANHPEFTDHFLVDWHLTREESYGRGAGARFRVAGHNRYSWADVTLVEVEPPYRIVEEGRGGKSNRVRLRTVYTLTPGASDTTRVELTTETDPPTVADRLMEAGQRRAVKRHQARALRRLRSVLEEGRDRGRRVTVAAG